MNINRFAMLFLFLFAFAGVFLFPPPNYPVDPAYACCIGDVVWSSNCPSGYDGCGVGKCCCGTCCVNCYTPYCHTVQGSATVYTLPFTYTRDCYAGAVTVYTLPFATEYGTYYTLPASFSYYTGSWY